MNTIQLHKKNIYIVALFLIMLGTSMYSQVIISDKNYIHSVTPQQPVTIENINNVGGDNDPAHKRHIQEVTYHDGLGRPEQQIAIKASATANTNLFPMDWNQGSGGTPFFNQNGATAENSRELGTSPFGVQSLLWKCGNDAARDADGGWNTDYFAIDKNVGYQYTVWIKRTGAQNGNAYHGTQNVNNLDGTANGNPYFWVGNPPQLDTWYLLVGVIHPAQYTGGNSGISGVYDINGNKVHNGNDFKWRNDTSSSRFRSYLYYSTDISVRQYFWNPMVQKIDGSESTVVEIIKNLETGSKDIVTPITYDDYGRQSRQHLPYQAAGISGSYRSVDIQNDINSYYQNKYTDDFAGMTINDVNAYSESLFEPSPLNRVLKQGAPGKAWKIDPTSNNDRSIKFDWNSNSANEVVYFTVEFANPSNTAIPSLKQEGFYANNQLHVTITKDENWQPGQTHPNDHTTKEYKDKQGRVVLKRTYNQGEAHDTYYVYDDFGNLTYVIPPKVNVTDGVSASELTELCYQYKYDHRNRLIEKQIPGKGLECIVYNKLDQPILTQDANLKDKKHWLLTKYDAFGRVAYTGLVSDGSVRKIIQSRVNASTAPQFETKQDIPTSIARTNVYYSKDAYPPRGILKIYTINYYDDYNFDTAGLNNPGTVFGQAISNRTRSLPTATKVRVLDTNDWITTVTYYDQKGRPIYVASKNEYLNTTDIVENKLDFTGKVEQTKTTHTKGNNAPIVTIDTFTYDHMGRLLTQTQKINDQDEEQIVANTYDELGLLIKKNVGGASSDLSTQGSSSIEATRSAGLQEVNYTYNVRGWLAQINNPETNLGNDLFAFKIGYNQGNNPLYNGNISKTSWVTANDNKKRWYDYEYDALNRITRAISNDDNYNLYVTQYDKVGNILELNRKGRNNLQATTFGYMDILKYDYDSGNKLIKVTDTGSKTYGFKDGTNTNDDYDYDLNGNMTQDQNKGITGIDYNHLNLPNKVTVNNPDHTGNITYIYDAAGTKLKKIVTEGSSITHTEYAGGFVYKNSQLQYFSTPEGYVTPEGNKYRYVYQYKDHLDNVRLSYTKNDNGDLEIIQEKNFYPFGLRHKGYNNVVNGTHHPYTFNGKEEQEELGLKWLDFGFRNYDASLGRWMNVDNLAEQYYNYSPYTYTANNPIYYIDPDGQQIIIHYQDDDGNDQEHIYKYGEKYDGDNQFIKDVYSSLNHLIDNDADTTGLIKKLAGDELGDVNVLQNTKENNEFFGNDKMATYFNSETNTVIWDSEIGVSQEQNSVWDWITGDGYEHEALVSPAEALLHELGHAESSLEDPEQHKKDSKTPFTNGWDNKEEFDVIRKIENPAGKKLKRERVRDAHRGTPYRTVSPTSVKPKGKKKKS